MNNLLKKFIQILTDGRPMTRIESAITDRVSGLAVNKYVDYKGRWWLANNAWSWFRVPCEISLDDAHRHSFENVVEISNSKICGCFHCITFFKPTDIFRWTDLLKGGTALCPNCQVDSVLADASHYPITVEFLERMKEHYFKQPEDTSCVSVVKSPGV